MSRAEKPDAFLRVRFGAPDGNSEIAVYALQAAGNVDVRKLAGIATKLPFLGSMRTEKKLASIPWISDPWGIERTYGDPVKGTHALVRFIADGTYGYIVVVNSRTMDDQAMREIAEKLDSHVSMLANWMNWWSGVRREGILTSIGGWVGRVIAGLIVCGVLYLFGKTGALVRVGIETRRALDRLRRDMAAKHAVPGPKYLAARRGAVHRIAWPILGWGAAYALLWFIVPSKVFFGALLGLIVPSLGFFGILFTPFGEHEIEIPIDFH